METLTKPRTQIQVNLNETQLRAYKLLCYGLKNFSEEELRTMNEEQKRSITYDQDKFWKIVNSLKQLKTAAFLHRLYFRAWPNAPVTEAMKILFQPVLDPNFVVTGKEINVEQGIIIRECCKAGLLPKNFLAD